METTLESPGFHLHMLSVVTFEYSLKAGIFHVIFAFCGTSEAQNTRKSWKILGLASLP